MFDSREIVSSDYDDARLEEMLGVAKQRSAMFRRRHHRRRSIAGALALVLVIALVTSYVARPATGPRTAHTSVTAPPAPPTAVKAPAWKLVGDITQGTWRLNSSSGYQPGIDLTCPDATTCYLEVDSSAGPPPAQVEVTRDGGATWQLSTLPGDLMPTTGIDCVDANTCFLGGQSTSGSNEIVTTGDGGHTWTLLPLSLQLQSPFEFADVSCVTATSCVAVGTSGGFSDGPSSAIVTTDGGQSWTTSDFPASFVPSAVRCLSGGSCVTVGYSGPSSGEGVVLYSADGGSTWSSATAPASVGPVNKIWCSNDGSTCLASAFGKPSPLPGAVPGAVIVGADGKPSGFPGAVIVSSDGGQTWTEAASTGVPTPFWTSVSCVTSSYCWASGLTIDTASQSSPRQPLLAMTTDQGQSWQTAQLPASLDLIAVPAVSCPATNQCFALGIQDPGQIGEPPQSQPRFVLLSYQS